MNDNNRNNNPFMIDNNEVGAGIGLGDIGAGIGIGIGGAGFGMGDIGDGIGGAGFGFGIGIGGLGLGGVGGAFGFDHQAGAQAAGHNQAAIGGFAQGFLSSHFDLERLQNPAQTAMRLNEEERRCALEIEQAVAASSSMSTDSSTDSSTDDSTQSLSLSPLTAMQYAQHAVIAQGNVHQAMQRIHGMQHFQQLYEIDDTVEQGVQAVQALLEQQPGYILDVDSNPRDHESTLVMDMRAFHPAKALQQHTPTASHCTTSKNLHHNWSVLVRGHYYLNRACQPTLASVRQGLVMVLDCDGMEWDKNVNTELDLQLHAELGAHYPRKFQKIQAYNTASVANVWFGLCKRIHSNSNANGNGNTAVAIERVINQNQDPNIHHQRNQDQDHSFYGALQLGCKAVDIDASRAPRRMSEAYLPTNAQDQSSSLRRVEALQEKILTRVRELLELRHVNETQFELPTMPIPAVEPAHHHHQQHNPFQIPPFHPPQQQHQHAW